MPCYSIDPPNGHAFGFPKRFVGDIDALNIDAWLRDNGYPDELLAMFPSGEGCRILLEDDPAASQELPKE